MYANSLYDLGIAVELRWVPAHSSIEGNERVDRLAKRCRRMAQSLLTGKLAGVMLKDITVTSSSPEEIYRTILSHIVPQLQNDDENVRLKKRINLDVGGDVVPRKKRKLALQD
jgi:hypothetical protein